MDKEFANTIWKEMAPLKIVFSYEQYTVGVVNQHIDYIDISGCSHRNCSIFCGYNFNTIQLDEKVIGTKKSTHNSLCSFISNCDVIDAARRIQDVLKLSTFVNGRHYGQCGKNVAEDSRGKLYELEHNCKFYTAFENTRKEDYVTEKFFEGIKAIENGAKVLMIYDGATNVESFGFPKDVFINRNDFSSVDELGKYLKSLSEDELLFNQTFLRAFSKQNIPIIEKVFNYHYLKRTDTTVCRMCTSIAEVKLARYLLYKCGLFEKATWGEFRERMKVLLSNESNRLSILDSMFEIAYGRVFKKNLSETNWNDYSYNYNTP
ncbi:predicted protein [Naegleria gruberi]|uniref:Fucosyltransferase n=1 Tax=Naegleria gruberi TaxID=5762 RepID=D2VYB7_NAEGR|nr:uncharacterized protein NAEGRDRAFT_59580 [Naegleria gruberi]EFC38175.1 predicted protein [Naegleria gruberi]|eukprot:XP_002670919.1 predicted protein [Naegleria gruberi strain NEG-M]